MKKTEEINKPDYREFYKHSVTSSFDWEEFYEVFKGWDKFKELSSKIGIEKDVSKDQWIHIAYKNKVLFIAHLEALLEIVHLQRKNKEGKYENFIIM